MGSRTSGSLTSSPKEHLVCVKDISLAIFLSYSEREPIRTTWSTDVTKCWWWYANDGGITEQIDEFYGNKANVDPARYYPHVVSFKREMYSARDRERGIAAPEADE